MSDNKNPYSISQDEVSWAQKTIMSVTGWQFDYAKLEWKLSFSNGFRQRQKSPPDFFTDTERFKQAEDYLQNLSETGYTMYKQSCRFLTGNEVPHCLKVMQLAAHLEYSQRSKHGPKKE